MKGRLLYIQAAVVGISCRNDVMELLEKRVRFALLFVRSTVYRVYKMKVNNMPAFKRPNIHLLSAFKKCQEGCFMVHRRSRFSYRRQLVLAPTEADFDSSGANRC